MNRLGKPYGFPPSRCKLARKNRYYPLLTQQVGVELELTYEGQRLLIKAVPGWDKTSDGSIKRGNGVEYRFDAAAGGPEINCKLAHMRQFIRANSDNLSTNETCATHVHLDMTDFPIFRLRRLMEVVLATEPYLFSYAGGSRDANIFCVPWSMSLHPRDISFLCRSIADGCIAEWEGAGRISKYSCVNPMSLPTFGTFEFRHMPGTLDMQVVKEWIGMCMHVKRVAMFTDDDLMDKIDDPHYLFGDLLDKIDLPKPPHQHLNRVGGLILASRSFDQENED